MITLKTFVIALVVLAVLATTAMASMNRPRYCNDGVRATSCFTHGGERTNP